MNWIAQKVRSLEGKVAEHESKLNLYKAVNESTGTDADPSASSSVPPPAIATTFYLDADELDEAGNEYFPEA
eukprot:61005-Alexandrium_andersonii.AAC.1